ncbi:MAG: sigma 54-interacting transcriptional regulator [Candidatus Brocadiaceae bacterium]
MPSSASQDGERRRYPRSPIEVAVQFYESKRRESVGSGTTLNISPVGLLVECPEAGGLLPGQEVFVHVGPGLDTSGTDAQVRGKVCRVEDGEPAFCAVEVVSDPPLSLYGPELLGTHPRILEVKRKLREIVDYNVNVLIRGENGTGKNVAAELIHRYSRRAGSPFVRVNCPSIPDTLFSSQLFGNEKGAFTDARVARPGLFRIADGGTILLDEISAIPSSLQAKLLEVIEAKRFFPVGGASPVVVDVRVIATTNANLERRMREGSFRRDLFYRLNEVDLALPALRDRRGDIALLADYFLRKYCREFGKQYRPLDRSAMDAFHKYPWPGNVRELENTVKRWVLMGGVGPTGALELESWTDVSDPPRSRGRPGSGVSLEQARRAAEREALLDALRAAEYDKSKAADLLQVSHRTLRRKIQQLLDGSLSAANGEEGLLETPTSGGLQSPFSGDEEGGCDPMSEAADRAEREAVIRALEATGYDRTRAAARLDVSYRTLLRKMKRYDIQA